MYFADELSFSPGATKRLADEMRVFVHELMTPQTRMRIEEIARAWLRDELLKLLGGSSNLVGDHVDVRCFFDAPTGVVRFGVIARTRYGEEMLQQIATRS